jgi:hypothetical protein
MILLATGGTLFVDGENLWGPAFHIAVPGGRAYVCAGRHLLVLDVKDPSRPAKLGQLSFSDAVTSVEVSGELGIIDVSDPANPVLLGFCPIGEGVHHYPRAIVAANGFAYIAATLGGVVIVDVSDPTKPKVAARFKTSTQT